MSCSRQFSDGTRPEKSQFAKTCNLLSQHVKEKGSLRDLNLQLGAKFETPKDILKPGPTQGELTSATMNLLTKMEQSAQPASTPAFPQVESFNNMMGDVSKACISNDATKTEPKTAPLTIFYSGRVLVFEDYPAEKAKVLLSFAESMNRASRDLLSSSLKKPLPVGVVAADFNKQQQLPPRPRASNTHRPVSIMSKTYMQTTTPSTCVAVTPSLRSEQSLPQPVAADASDLPIARRSSLHRFLEKRKDRAATRGPYQIQEQLAASSSKGDDQLELKL